MPGWSLPFRLSDPGYGALTIDNEPFYPLPRDFRPDLQLIQTATPLLSSGTKLDGIYLGEGMPNVADHFVCEIPYALDENFAALCETLEILRTSGTPHDLCYWKQLAYTYSAQAGASVFYSPRADAWGMSIAPFYRDETVVKAIVELNGVAQNVVYKPSVTLSTVVTPGEVWFSEATGLHPNSQRRSNLFKFGTPLAAAGTVRLKFFPVFQVGVTNAPTEFRGAGREDKTLFLEEL
ncbi:MAG TPA: hypothetical protein VNL91_04185 [Thermoanaerobaculia bacterium]|nr:hypothetical protein [Thermoanaerobaculia bacterium]